MQKYAEKSQMGFRLIYHVLVLVVEILAVLLVVFGIVQCCRMSYQFGYEVFGSVSVEEGPGTDKDFEVKESETVYHVAKRLQKEGLVKNGYSFFIKTVLTGQEEDGFHSGKYVLNTSMDYEDIINILVKRE